jgi:hypothetical protein
LDSTDYSYKPNYHNGQQTFPSYGKDKKDSRRAKSILGTGFAVQYHPSTVQQT